MPSRLRGMEDSLTQEEREAATYLEWSDSTIAMGVRAIFKHRQGERPDNGHRER